MMKKIMHYAQHTLVCPFATRMKNTEIVYPRKSSIFTVNVFNIVDAETPLSELIQASVNKLNVTGDRSH